MLCFTGLVFRIWIAIFRVLSQWYFIFNIDVYVRLKIVLELDYSDNILFGSPSIGFGFVLSPIT